MYLLYGVLIFSCVVLWWALALICCKNPNRRWYASETMQTYGWTIFGLTGLVFGLMFIVKSLPEFPPSGREAGLVAAVIVVTVFIYRMLRVGERLSSYERIKAQTKITAIDSLGEGTFPHAPGKKPRVPFFKKAA